MTKLKRMCLTALALVFAVAMAVGCSTQATGPAAIKIGLSTALSGPAAPWGIPHLQAAELVADKYNADGGIYIEAAGKKLPIEIIAYDDKYTPSEAAIAGKKLIEQDKVHVIANMGEEMATTIRGMAMMRGSFSGVRRGSCQTPTRTTRSASRA